MKSPVLTQSNFQYNYQIQAHHFAAAAGGAHGKGVAIDTMFNGLINDKGCRNTNKAGDLKVESENKRWKDRSNDLKGNFTELSLQRISK